MKIAMVLPIFSEHAMRDYLGINLVVNFLEKNDYNVECIDLNETLVSYLLSDQKVIGREFGNLSAIMDNYPKIVISLNEYAPDNIEGIQHDYLQDFLNQF